MKKYIALVLLVLAFFNLAAFSAGAYTTYDPATGNHYNVTNSFGNTHIQGRNTYTGSNWNTNIDSHGNMRGIDASGHSWNYNSMSGYYTNSNGTVCTGKGSSRVCY